jgi:hypothetical protein
MALTPAQQQALSQMEFAVQNRLPRLHSILLNGTFINELGATITLTDTQIANAIAALKTIANNLNTLVQSL